MIGSTEMALIESDGLKLVPLGDCLVGKTSIIRRFVYDRFTSEVRYLWNQEFIGMYYGSRQSVS